MSKLQPFPGKNLNQKHIAGQGDKKNTFIWETVKDKIGPAQIQRASPPD
jgi:hypothetical protein